MKTDIKKYIIEFLIYYNVDGVVSANELIDKLYMNPTRKFNKLKHKKFLTKLLNILVQNKLIDEVKVIRRQYFNDRIYKVNLAEIQSKFGDMK